MKRSKMAVFLSLLLAVSVFGAACSSKKSSTKKTKKTKVEATDDETKKTKKTKKTKDTEETEETEAPSETTEATTTTSETTEITTTTTTESTTAPSDTTPAGTSDSAQTSGSQGTFDMPAPNTDGYKAISADAFTSGVEAEGYTVMDAMSMGTDTDVKAKALLMAFDPTYKITFIYYQYMNASDAKAAYDQAIGFTKDFQDKDYQFYITDNTMVSYSEMDNEYTVVIIIDDMEILAVTDTDSNNIDSMNSMLADLGYRIK